MFGVHDRPGTPGQPCFRTLLSVSGAPSDEVARLYLAWALALPPLGPAPSGGPKPPVVTLEEALRGGDFTGGRTWLRVRSSDGGPFLLQWSVGDLLLGEVHARHHVRLADTPAGVRVEHAVLRSLPEGAARPRLRPPTILEHLLTAFSGRIAPEEVAFGTPAEIVEEDVGGFVDSLLSPERTYPVVFVTPANRGGATLVDPEELARALVGVAEVQVLANADLSWAVRDALLARGSTVKHSCFDGGVRLYRPGFTALAPLADHPLFLRTLLTDTPPAERVFRLAERVAALLADEVDGHGLAIEIERQPRPASAPTGAPTHAAGPARLPSQPSPSPEPLLAEVELLRAKVVKLEAEVKGYDGLLGDADVECRAAEDRARVAERARAQAEQERDVAREDAEGAYNLATVADAVEAVRRLHPDRVVVFPAVAKSADDSPYHRPQHAFLVLTLLALTTDDGELRAMLDRHFSDRQAKWRGTDSEATEKTFPRRFVGEDGRVNTSSKHITLGGSERADRHLQVYYDRLPGGKVAILHVGRHLPTVSYDT